MAVQFRLCNKIFVFFFCDKLFSLSEVSLYSESFSLLRQLLKAACNAITILKIRFSCAENE